jgi:hypothetical protein
MIAITFLSSVSHGNSTSFCKMWNRRPATIACSGIQIRWCVPSPKDDLQSAWCSHRGQFCTLPTLDACGNLPAFVQTNPTIFTHYPHQPDFPPEIMPPALSTVASTLLRFLRCSIAILQTSGGPSAASCAYWLFEPFALTWSVNISVIEPS